MKKYYCEQVDPEWQEDNLFYNYDDKNTGRRKIGWNDDIYENNIILYGNDEYLYSLTKEFENLLELETIWYEYEPLTYKSSNHCYWNNVSDFVNCYFPKSNGKKYSTKEIHKWKELLEKSQGWKLKEIVCDALELMTGKKWREIEIRGCMQREWQEGYASEEITDKDLEYIEACYYNTGTEWRLYESKQDYKNNEPSTSLYIVGYDYKKELCDLIGCKENELVCYMFDGYSKSPKYRQI